MFFQLITLLELSTHDVLVHETSSQGTSKNRTFTFLKIYEYIARSSNTIYFVINE